MKSTYNQKVIGLMLIVFLTVSISACSQKIFSHDSEFFRGEYCTVYVLRDDGSGEESTDVEFNGLQKKELSRGVAEKIEKLGGKGATSVKLGTAEYSLMVETPEGRKRSYGITAGSIEDVEELLGINLMMPDGTEGTDELNYLLIMDPEFNEISINSVPLSWKDYRIEFSAWLYRDKAPTFLRVGTLACAEPACYTESAIEEKHCDVIADKENDRAWLIMVEENVAYSYKVNFSDEKRIQEFLEELR